MLVLLVSIVLNSILVCQEIENGWHGIKPLRTDKATVENLLGRPEVDDNGYHGYLSDEAFVRVDYATVPCSDDPYKRGQYKVTQNTVIDYTVVLKKVVKLTDLKLKKEKYYRDTSGDVLNFVDYVDSNKGITISVTVQGEDEFVRKISFRPSKADALKFSCDKGT